jgi:hypothetical protein
VKNLNVEKEVKIVRYLLIPIVFFASLGLEGIGIAPWVNYQYSDSNIITVSSGFGKITLSEFNQDIQPDFSDARTYHDYDLSYKVSRPNDSWQFDRNIDEVLKESGKKLYANGFLGGIHITKNNDKVFLITVFDLSSTKNFQLDNFVSTQLEQLEGSDVKVSVKFISNDQRWALVGMEINNVNQSIYGEQLLHYHDGTLYILNYVGNSPKDMENTKKEEIRKIIDSFESM